MEREKAEGAKDCLVKVCSSPSGRSFAAECTGMRRIFRMLISLLAPKFEKETIAGK